MNFDQRRRKYERQEAYDIWITVRVDRDDDPRDVDKWDLDDIVVRTVEDHDPTPE